MQSQGTQFNPRASLDAAVAFSLLLGAEWRRASEPGRWASRIERYEQVPD